MFIWVAINENVKQAKILWTFTEQCMNPKSLLDLPEKLLYSEQFGANISSWSYDMEGHAKKCVERYCEMRNKTTQQLYRVATSCFDDHYFKEKLWDLSENCQRFAPKLFSNACIWHAWEDLIFLSSVNKFARAITKCTRACDNHLACLISYIHHTSEFKLYCHVETPHNNADWDCFRNLIFVRDLEDSKSISVRILCIFGSHTFVPRSWMCKIQTSVSHSSTEAEIIFLDSGLRMGGIPALDLWDLVVEVFHSHPNQSSNTKDQVRGNSSRNTTSNKHTQKPNQGSNPARQP